MPAQKINYKNNVNYMIVCKDPKIIDSYVGHTSNFHKRSSAHKSACLNNEKKLYKCIRNNGNWDNWTIILLEKYPCKTGLEASEREAYWYNIIKPSLNINVPNRNQKESLKIGMKKYYTNNKEAHKLKMKTYMKNKYRLEKFNKLCQLLIPNIDKEISEYKKFIIYTNTCYDYDRPFEIII